MWQPSRESVSSYGEHVSSGQSNQDSGAGLCSARQSVTEEEKPSDPIFGHGNFKKVGWIRVIPLMVKTEVGIGVLGIPLAFRQVGLVYGIVILTITCGTTTWSNYVVGQWRRAHPNTYGLEDAARAAFGVTYAYIFATAFYLYWIFVTGSAFVTLSTALDVFSGFKVCSAVWVAVAAIIGWVVSSVRTLNKISVAALVGMTCIFAAVCTVVIGVTLQDPPASAPQTGPWQSDWKIIGTPTFLQTVSAISTMVFSFSGTPAFFQIHAEMKEPKHYNRSMFISSALVLTVYAIAGSVIYVYCGSDVASPALGSAGRVLRMVAYAEAFPGLLVTTMIVAHLPAKALWLRFYIRRARRNRHTKQRLKHWASWFSCTFVVCLIGYIIASAIPGFAGLVELIGANSSFICIIPYGGLWLHLNLEASPFDENVSLWRNLRSLRYKQTSLRWRLLAFWALLATIFGVFCQIGGTFVAVRDIIALYKEITYKPWSCAHG